MNVWSGDAQATDILALGSLPRGRHSIPREVVEEIQHERLIAAMALLIAEEGYANTVVRNVCERAGVSRATFYEYFDGREECLLGSYRTFADRFLGTLRDACGEANWEDNIVAAIKAAVDFCSGEPAVARLVLVDGPAAAPESAELHREIVKRLAASLRTGRDHFPRAESLPECTEESLVGGAAAAIAGCLLAHEAERIPRLVPQLIEFVLSPYTGAARARRLAGKRQAVQTG